MQPTREDLARDLRQDLADLESVDYGHCASILLWSMAPAAIRRALAAEQALAAVWGALGGAPPVPAARVVVEAVQRADALVSRLQAHIAREEQEDG